MAYIHYDDSVPDGATETPTEIGDSARLNLQALAHMIIMAGTIPGWDMTTSDDDGTEPATTPETPDWIISKNGTQWVRLAMTYNGSDNVSSVVAAYSINSGSSYDTIGTLTITYDANQNVLSSAWS